MAQMVQVIPISRSQKNTAARQFRKGKGCLLGDKAFRDANTLCWFFFSLLWQTSWPEQLKERRVYFNSNFRMLLNMEGKLRILKHLVLQDWKSEKTSKNILLFNFLSARTQFKSQAREWHHPELTVLPCPIKEVKIIPSRHTHFPDDSRYYWVHS